MTQPGSYKYLKYHILKNEVHSYFDLCIAFGLKHLSLSSS